MKFFMVLLSFLGCFSYISTDDKYTTRYDDVNIDDIISNERLLKRYVDCLLDQGVCTPDAMELKSK